jgi:hypothetical protein
MPICVDPSDREMEVGNGLLKTNGLVGKWRDCQWDESTGVMEWKNGFRTQEGTRRESRGAASGGVGVLIQTRVLRNAGGGRGQATWREGC